MTADQHRAIGAILGFPSCCVEAWIRGDAIASQNGSITTHVRSFREAYRLHERVSRLLGYPWGICALSGDAARRADRRCCYVPCTQCALVDDRWRPWGLV